MAGQPNRKSASDTASYYRCSVQANSKEILCILKFELLMVNNCQHVLIILYILFFQSLSSSHTMFGQNLSPTYYTPFIRYTVGTDEENNTMLTLRSSWQHAHFIFTGSKVKILAWTTTILAYVLCSLPQSPQANFGISPYITP